MFRTRVTAAIEEIKHFRWCPTENQLPEAQNGDFVEELIGEQTVLVYDQVTTCLWEKSFQSSQSFADLRHASVFFQNASPFFSAWWPVCIRSVPSITSGVEENYRA